MSARLTLELNLNMLDFRLNALRKRRDQINSSADVRRGMPLRIAILDDEIAVTEHERASFEGALARLTEREAGR